LPAPGIDKLFFWCALPNLAVFIIFVIFSAIKKSIYPIQFLGKEGFEHTSEDHGSYRESSAFTTRPGGFPWYVRQT